MATLLLVVVVVLVIAGLVFGVVSLLAGDDPGLVPAEPDGRARPLPNDRSLHEDDLREVRFDLALRGYRMGQVDRVLRRTAYDLGYKDEMIAVLEAEVAALREGRLADAEVLRQAREAAANPEPQAPTGSGSSDAMAGGTTGFIDLDEAPDTVPDAAEDERGDEAAASAEEPPEGSLRRRNPVPDVAAILAGARPSAGNGSTSGVEVGSGSTGGSAAAGSSGGDVVTPAEKLDEPHAGLEVADRPAHA